MAEMTVEMDETEYRVVSADGQLGQETPYGDVAVLRIGEAVYYAVVDDPDATDAKVYRVDTVTEIACKVDDVSFADTEDGEEGEDVEETIGDGGTTTVLEAAADGDEEDDEEDEEDEEEGGDADEDEEDADEEDDEEE